MRWALSHMRFLANLKKIVLYKPYFLTMKQLSQDCNKEVTTLLIWLVGS